MRRGEVFPAGLGGMPLRFGDALLVYGRREKHELLAQDPDFLVLTRETLVSDSGDKQSLLRRTRDAAQEYRPPPAPLRSLLKDPAILKGGEGNDLDEAYGAFAHLITDAFENPTFLKESVYPLLIDSLQRRPDAPKGASEAALNALRKEIGAQVVASDHRWGRRRPRR